MTITSVERQRNNKERFSIFVDGEFAFGMSGTDVLYYKLEPGDELTPERYDYLINEVLFTKAKDSALRYLGYRARTRKELVEKLADYPAEVTDKVLYMLEKYGYLDDFSFARDYVESRTRSKGYGMYRIKRELREKGIDSSIIDEVLAESDFDEVNAAVEKLRRKFKGDLDEREKQKLFGYLARQGFGYDIIKQAFKEYEEDSLEV